MSETAHVYLGVDLGASSGRVVAGCFDGAQLTLEELHRFENGPVYVGERMHWDLLGLWKQVQAGLQVAAGTFGQSAVSIGVDTWGVDFGLLSASNELLGNPYHYRDRRTSGMVERVLQIISRETIFAETGLQFMELNTLYQIVAMKWAHSPLLEVAETFLMIPDLFHWLLTGEQSIEFTNATTTQLYNPTTHAWSETLLHELELPSSLFRPPSPPGTNLGPLTSSVAESTGLRGTRVILPGTHDTASAVAAVPAKSSQSDPPNWCYISSGTWSLMGVEVHRPVTSDRCRELNFTNEGGVAGTIRLLKNIAGLWLLQECRRIWQLGGQPYDWDQLVGLAKEAPALTSLIDPDDARFIAPKEMPDEIQRFCQETNQPVPDSHGAIVRCALESLALRYRRVLLWLEELTGGTIEVVHIVGGGAQNQLLSQMAADACNRRVVTGPVEATAIGNVMMQAISLGDVQSLAAAREVIRNSFPTAEFVPNQAASWETACDRFDAICSSGK